MRTSSSPVTSFREATGILLVTLSIALLQNVCHAENTIDHAVMVSATIQRSPANITLTWPAGANATGYSVYKKALGATSWGQIAGLGSGATSCSDSSVAVGQAYEYRVIKSTNAGYTGYGYIYAGIDAPFTEYRGKLVLLVDSSVSGSLVNELNQLQQDLVGDGWVVLRHDVSRSATPSQIKDVIRNDYNGDPTNVKAVFLFGHVPVPYSGGTAWDGHIPDHQGAWAADTFYGDLNGSWSDNSVNYTSGLRFAENINQPGDGKFDQSYLPSDVEVAVGRVDFYNMPVFSGKSETDLLRRYLNKDHNFRQKQFSMPARGMVTDNFGTFGGEAFAADGFRNLAPMFGAGNVAQVGVNSYLSTLINNAYLWSYGTGPGDVASCSGVAVSSDFANYDPKCVFNFYFGSWFGDFDKQNNFLRASIGSNTYTLTSCWGGRPYWYFHPMALGETIGTCTRISQNNNGVYDRGGVDGLRGTHMCLMGDPSLRMHTVSPPYNVSVNNGVVSWSASPDSSIQGYLVYRASSSAGPFSRVSPNFVTGVSFTDPNPGSYTYMVRAIKLESSGSGTYYNPSQGAFVGGSTPPPPPPPPPPPTAGNGNGLLGTYFPTTNFSGTPASRTDSTVNFDWGTGAPIAGIPADNFSVRWSGQVQPQFTENYTFYTTTDDGVRLWVNNVLVIDKWTDQGATEWSGSISLTAGQKYSIQMDYYDHTGGAAAKLAWSSGSTPKAIIPQSQLYSSGPTGGSGGDGLLGSYYTNNTALSGTPVTRVDPTVNFDWGAGAPISGVSSDNFSVRWTGQVQAQFSETYTFYTASDDGARLWVNNVLLIDKWMNQSTTEYSATIALSAGQKYAIRMEYYDASGGAVARLSWSSPSTAKAIIPQSQLFSGSGGGDGLLGSYYSNTTAFAGSPATRVDSSVNFDWGGGSPMSGVSSDNFCVRWTGQVQPQFSETYTFYTQTDDGVRLWVNNVLLVDKWINQGTTEWFATINLTANQKYDIRMDYFDSGGGAVAKLLWSSPSTAKAIIPQSRLYSNSAGSGDGLLGTYFAGYFSGTSVQFVDKTVNYDWGAGSPAAGIPADHFTVRWTGQVQPQYSETYTFWTTTDDGVRLWVNNVLLIDKWIDQGPTEYGATINLTGGQKYDIRMEYYDNTGGAVAKLSWSSPSTPKAIIPQARLFSNSGGAVASRSLATPAPSSDSSDSDSTDDTTDANATPVKPPAPATEEF